MADFLLSLVYAVDDHGDGKDFLVKSSYTITRSTKMGDFGACNHDDLKAMDSMIDTIIAYQKKNLCEEDNKAGIVRFYKLLSHSLVKL